MLAGDILPKPDDKSVSPQEAAFREQLWKQLASQPILAIVGPGTRPQPLFNYKWGEGSWELNHDKGAIAFKHLLQIEKWNLDYQQALLKRDLEITSNMEKRLRDLGGGRLDITGKKVGELWGYVWNTNVKVAEEVGKPTGYVDDSQGRTQMYSTFYGAKGARAIVKAPDGWLHVYKLDENLNTLNRPEAARARRRRLQLHAGDRGGGHPRDDRHLQRRGARERAPQGWRCKTDPNQIGTIEQFAIGAIFGDFWEDPNAPAIVGQIFIGVIPIVGQIADARDVIAGVIKIYETGGKDGKFQTAMALVGFIPLFGDAIKAAKGGGKKAAVEAAKEAAPATTKALAKELAQDAAKVAKTFGVEEVRKAFPNLGEQVAKALGDGGPEAAEELAKSVKTAMEQFGGNAGHVVAASGGKWADLAKALGKVARGRGRRRGDAGVAPGGDRGHEEPPSRRAPPTSARRSAGSSSRRASSRPAPAAT